MKRITLVSVSALILTGVVMTAQPPDTINYQGVLRNASEQPLDGTVAMVFRFFDAATGGNEILIDTHGAVTVSDGLFNVELGSGLLADGSGPGSFATLAHVFGKHPELYLEVEVNGETLTPRTPISASGYALNSRRVRGVDLVSDGPLTLWVDGSGGGCGGLGCSDSNGGLSLNTAKLTIRGAIEEMPALLAGDIPTDAPVDGDAVRIRVQPGAYAGGVMFSPRMRNQFSFVHLLGDGTNPSDVEIDCNGAGDGLYAWDTLLRVSNLTIKNCDNGIQAQGGSETFLTSCRILNNDDGINVFGSAVEINDCEISGNGGVGLKAERSSHVVIAGGVTICGNTDLDAEASFNSSITFESASCVISNISTPSELGATFSSIQGLGNCSSCP